VIIRILGEGQYDVAEDAIDGLNELDSSLEAAVESGDATAFASALAALLDAVRSVGTAHPVDSLDESDLILPRADATLEDVRELLQEDGLIPG